MATPDLAAAVRLETSLDGEFPPLIEATLLPDTGPTYAQLVESRRRWIAGETVKPIGVAVGTVALRNGLQAELTKTLSTFQFTKLYDGPSDSIDCTFGRQEKSLRAMALIHFLVHQTAMLDAWRRGVEDPQAYLWATYGGVTAPDDRAAPLHVDNEYSPGVALRYALTAVGKSTGLDLSEVSKDAVGLDGYVQTGSATDPPPAPEENTDGVAKLILFELHTPHYRPMGTRLFSTLDIAERGMDYI